LLCLFGALASPACFTYGGGMMMPPPLMVANTAPPAALAGQAFSFNIQVTGGTAPYTLTESTMLFPGGMGVNGTPCQGLMLNFATGAVTGTPVNSGTCGPVSFTVTDSSTPALTFQFSLSFRIVAVLAITTTTLPNGTEGVAYNQTVTTTGGATPLAFSISAGALPPGLMLNATSGAITGMPTMGGAFNFTVRAADSLTPAQAVTQAYTILILQITTATLPDGTVNVAYNQPLAITGEVPPVNWTLTPGSGPLPPGLMLDANTGAISGTPTQAGTFNFTAQATDSDNPARTDTQALSIRIIAPLVISTATLPNGIEAAGYNQTVMTAGGFAPINFAVTAGALPPGLMLNMVTGALVGIPTMGGTFNFTVTATDSFNPAQTDSQVYAMLILQITTAALPNGTINVAYNQALAITGEIAPVNWTLAPGSGPLPPGLMLDANTGIISGTPTQAGTFNFTVQATDSDAPARVHTQALSIQIAAVPAPLSITTTAIPNGVFNIAYNQTIMTNGGVGPLMFAITLGSLPVGMNLDPNTGVISGTPTAGGMFPITVEVTDSSNPAQTASQAYTLLILQISTQSLPDGVEGQPYSQNLTVAGAVLPVGWILALGSGPLPPGLTLSGGGTISGTPTQPGTFNFLVRVTDSDTPPRSDVQALSITINPAPPPPPPSSITDVHITRTAGPGPFSSVSSFRHDAVANTLAIRMLPPPATFPIPYTGTQPGPIVGDNTLIAVGEADVFDLDFTDGFVTFFTGDGQGNFTQDGAPIPVGSLVAALAFDPTKTLLFASVSSPTFEQQIVVINVASKTVVNVVTSTMTSTFAATALLANPDPSLRVLYGLGSNASPSIGLFMWTYDLSGNLFRDFNVPAIAFPNSFAIKNQRLYIGTNASGAMGQSAGLQYVINLVAGLPAGNNFIGPIGGGGLFGEAVVPSADPGVVCKYAADGGGNLRIFLADEGTLVIVEDLDSPFPALPGEFFFLPVAHPTQPIIYAFGVGNFDPDGPGPIPALPAAVLDVFNVDTQTCNLTDPPAGPLRALVPGPPGPISSALVVPQ
jgi:hypothetical protein